MIAFIVKWVGVGFCTAFVYGGFAAYVSRGTFHLGQANISYAFVAALVFFILGAKVTAKSK